MKTSDKRRRQKREDYYRHRIERIAMAKTWADKKRLEPGYVPSCKKYRLEKMYSINQADYDKMLKEQNGVCGICHIPHGSKSFAVDHDHRCCSGKKSCGKCIRGLICSRCNFVLGLADDNTDRLRNSIAYLKQYAMC